MCVDAAHTHQEGSRVVDRWPKVLGLVMETGSPLGAVGQVKHLENGVPTLLGIPRPIERVVGRLVQREMRGGGGGGREPKAKYTAAAVMADTFGVYVASLVGEVGPSQQAGVGYGLRHITTTLYQLEG